MSPKLSPPAAQRSMMIDSRWESAGQRGGGCEIRTREGLPPTRFPTMLASVHRRPPPSATCPNTTGVAADERPRTGVNETRTETSGLRRYRLGRAFSGQCALSAGPLQVRQRADPALTPAQPVRVVAEYVLDRGSDSSDGVAAACPR
jgi:hypothetical protein